MNMSQVEGSGPLQIPDLPDSSPLLSDPAALRARWEEEGVLFFRGAVSRPAVAAVQAEYLARLKEMGVVDDGEAESRWNGSNRVDGRLARPIDDEVWRTLVADPSLDGIVRTFLGEAPSWVPIVVHRTAPPASGAAAGDPFAARHQDGIYNYGIDFVTCWIPLMDIDDEVGGLAVVPGSHKGSLYPPDVFKDPGRRVGIPADAVPDGGWRRPDYKAGDMLMFHSMTAHAGLPNRSDRLRLSMDIRFLPRSVVPFVGKVVRTDAASVEVSDEGGERATFAIDANTVVRGPKGHPVLGSDRAGILFPDADVIVMPDGCGAAKLVRSVSRKYVDLPAAWYDVFPSDWVK